MFKKIFLFLIILIKINIKHSICPGTKSKSEINKSLKFLSSNSEEKENNEEIEKEYINLSDYDYPKLTELADDEFLIPILGTNDIHGQAYEKDLINHNITYKVGGYKLLSGLINILRKEYKNQILWFAAAFKI